jgi:hypothetical protein
MHTHEGTNAMTGLPQNVHDLLSRLNETSRHELDLVRDLSEAIRRVDDQLLKEVRSVTMLHELRREAIVSELQLLAQRLCVLPARDHLREPLTAIEQPHAPPHPQPVGGHAAHAEPGGAHPANGSAMNGHAPAGASRLDASDDGLQIAEADVITVEPPAAGRAGDWRQAAQRIDAELAQYFGGPGPRH